MQLLQGLQATDNPTRTKAEEQLNTAWVAQRPDVLLMGLAEQMEGATDEGVSSLRDKYGRELLTRLRRDPSPLSSSAESRLEPLKTLHLAKTRKSFSSSTTSRRLPSDRSCYSATQTSPRSRCATRSRMLWRRLRDSTRMRQSMVSHTSPEKAGRAGHALDGKDDGGVCFSDELIY